MKTSIVRKRKNTGKMKVKNRAIGSRRNSFSSVDRISEIANYIALDSPESAEK
ncbi:hypothetical protein M1O54_08280 [Dehalococcoidia bacterium]|nr:hypothetical protein [Dehalococcoidia bacterium]